MCEVHRAAKLIETESRMGWRGGGENRELVFNGYRVSALQEEKCVGRMEEMAAHQCEGS